MNEGTDPNLGRTLADRYRIDGLVARGGMARVYRARDERLDREVAVKVLAAPYADDPGFTDRFLEEARAAASLSHPSLVHVYDSGSDDGTHFIVMELLDRHRSLRDILEADGPRPVEEVVRIGQELLAGLRLVHDRGLVHCDVKSGNVMIGPGPAKLIDFGIARPPDRPEVGDTSIGSLRSMSPEQLRGESLTPASDLFGVGVVLYEAVTGRVPYAGETPAEVAEAHRAGIVRPPSELVDGVPSRLDSVVLQALRPEPERRFRSADAMAHALATVDAAPPTDPEAGNDTTRVVTVPRPARSGGYVPPTAPPEPRPEPVPRTGPPRAAGPRPRREPIARRLAGMAGLLGTLVVLGLAAAVIVFGVLPLLQSGQGGGGDPSAPATTEPTSAPGTVSVPGVVGLPTDEAIELAEDAGLDWTVFCNDDPSQPEGIIHQEPPAGTPVAPGSRFSMYSARFADDCG